MYGSYKTTDQLTQQEVKVEIAEASPTSAAVKFRVGDKLIEFLVDEQDLEYIGHSFDAAAKELRRHQ